MQSRYKLIYTAQFEVDLDRITDYFVNTIMVPSAYDNLVVRLKQKEQMLRDFPNSVKVFESNVSLNHTYHKYNVGNYSVFFYIDDVEKIVYIRRILYSGMDLINMNL